MKSLFLIAFLGLSVSFVSCNSDNETLPEEGQPVQPGDSDGETASDILWDNSHD